MIDEGVTKVLDKSEKADTKAKALASTGIATAGLGSALWRHLPFWLEVALWVVFVILMTLGAIKIQRRRKRELQQWLAKHPTSATDPFSYLEADRGSAGKGPD